MMGRLAARAAELRRSRLGRETAWMTGAYVAGFAFQGAYFVLLARLLGASGLGAFAAALACATILAPFSGLGGGTVLVMKTARDESAFRGELGAALKSIAVSGAAFVVLLGLIAKTALSGTSIGPLLVGLGLSELICGRVVDLAAQCFQAHDRVRASATITLSISAARLAAVVLFAVIDGTRSPLHWTYWYAGASAAVAAVSLAIVVAALGRPVLGEARALDQARTGVFFSLGSASKYIYGDIDKAMLARIASDSAAGIYTAAYRVMSMGYSPVLAFLYSSNTRFFRAGERGAIAVWKVARRGWPLLVGYSAALGACLALFAPLLPLVLGSDFDSSVEALRWLSAMPILMASHSLLGDALMGLGKQSIRSAAQLGTAALNVSLNLWLIPLLSWKGAALASLISEALLVLLLFGLLRWLVREERRSASGTASRPRAGDLEVAGSR